eukprot:scaffold151462_cov19-Tisochrysis_lutea.AAC.1
MRTTRIACAHLVTVGPIPYKAQLRDVRPRAAVGAARHAHHQVLINGQASIDHGGANAHVNVRQRALGLGGGEAAQGQRRAGHGAPTTKVTRCVTDTVIPVIQNKAAAPPEAKLHRPWSSSDSQREGGRSEAGTQPQSIGQATQQSSSARQAMGRSAHREHWGGSEKHEVASQTLRTRGDSAAQTPTNSEHDGALGQTEHFQRIASASPAPLNGVPLRGILEATSSQRSHDVLLPGWIHLPKDQVLVDSDRHGDV